MFMYECGSCDNKFEELFLSPKADTAETSCHFCNETATKCGVQRFTHVGPVFEGLDDYSIAFGKEVKTYKDIKKIEDEKGWSRMEHGSQAHKDYISSSKQEMYEMGDAYNKGSHIGLTDHIYKKEMIDGTGWSDAKYAKWKTAADTAESDARSGKVDISQKATAKTAAK
jgi:hypothetical protein